MYSFGFLCVKTEVQIEIGRPLTVEMLLTLDLCKLLPKCLIKVLKYIYLA